jgi:hypothetical protein
MVWDLMVVVVPSGYINHHANALAGAVVDRVGSFYRAAVLDSLPGSIAESEVVVPAHSR